MPDDRYPRRPRPPFERGAPFERGGPPQHSGPPPWRRPPREFTPASGGGGGDASHAEPTHSLRLRDGDREVELRGSAAFVRQTLDELPTLLARLRAEPMPPRAASIALPPAPPAAKPVGNGKAVEESLEDQVLTLLRESRKPMGIAEIRGRLDGDVSAQQVRRILERAGDRVVTTGERPAAYRLR
jgi:hypothetical protein